MKLGRPTRAEAVAQAMLDNRTRPSKADIEFLYMTARMLKMQYEMMVTEIEIQTDGPVDKKRLLTPLDNKARRTLARFSRRMA